MHSETTYRLEARGYEAGIWFRIQSYDTQNEAILEINRFGSYSSGLTFRIVKIATKVELEVVWESAKAN